MSYISFQVQLEECIFLSGSQIIEKEISTGTATSLLELDYERNKDRIVELTVIKVSHKISGKEYTFYSPSYPTTVEELKIEIVFLNSISIFYNEENPADYYFN